MYLAHIHSVTLTVMAKSRSSLYAEGVFRGLFSGPTVTDCLPLSHATVCRDTPITIMTWRQDAWVKILEYCNSCSSELVSPRSPRSVAERVTARFTLQTWISIFAPIDSLFPLALQFLFLHTSTEFRLSSKKGRIESLTAQVFSGFNTSTSHRGLCVFVCVCVCTYVFNCCFTYQTVPSYFHCEFFHYQWNSNSVKFSWLSCFVS